MVISEVEAVLVLCASVLLSFGVIYSKMDQKEFREVHLPGGRQTVQLPTKVRISGPSHQAEVSGTV